MTQKTSEGNKEVVDAFVNGDTETFKKHVHDVVVQQSRDQVFPDTGEDDKSSD